MAWDGFVDCVGGWRLHVIHQSMRFQRMNVWIVNLRLVCASKTLRAQFKQQSNWFFSTFSLRCSFLSVGFVLCEFESNMSSIAKLTLRNSPTKLFGIQSERKRNTIQIPDNHNNLSLKWRYHCFIVNSPDDWKCSCKQQFLDSESNWHNYKTFVEMNCIENWSRLCARCLQSHQQQK